MSPPIDSIDAAIDAMDNEVDRCLDCGDATGYFTVVYRAVTQRVRDGIAAGEFADGEQMARFDVLFAQRFLDARNAWNSGAADVPASWRLAFETAQRRRCLVAQHLLLGINAHINLDLGVAAAAAAPPGEVDALRDDFETINDVLAELVDRMQASLVAVSPWTRVGRCRRSPVRRGSRHVQPASRSGRGLGFRHQAQPGGAGRAAPPRDAARRRGRCARRTDRPARVARAVGRQRCAAARTSRSRECDCRARGTVRSLKIDEIRITYCVP